MSQTPNSGEAPAASLVGSLAVFGLPEILGLLADTKQLGELQVVGSGVDGRLWLEGGKLSGSMVGTTQTLTQAVFELALLEEGWFYFTADQVAPSPADAQTVASVIATVKPQVDEWRELLTKLPLSAVIRLSPEPPGPEVQIKADQWQVLTTLGNAGLSVGSVVTAQAHDQVVTLRILRDLLQTGLVELDREPVGPAEVGTAAAADPGEQAEVPAPPVDLPATDYITAEFSDNPPPPPPTPWQPPAAGDAFLPPPPPVVSPDEIFPPKNGDASMPPPISADPWAPPGSDTETVIESTKA